MPAVAVIKKQITGKDKRLELATGQVDQQAAGTCLVDILIFISSP
jgi:hypothetical protein